MKILICSIIAFLVLLSPALLQNVFGSQQCPPSGYIHYGPSRQYVPCYLVSLQNDENNTTSEKIHGGLNTTPLDANASKFEYKGEMIVINQTVSRMKLLDTKEHLLIHPEISNMGNASSGICYMWKPFFVVIFNNETLQWMEPNTPSVGTLEYNCNFIKDLKPGESFSHLALFYTQVGSVTLSTPGKYAIYSVTDFYSEEQQRSKKIFIWSKPYNVIVLPGEQITIDPTYDVSPPVQQVLHGISSRDVTCTNGMNLLWNHDHKNTSCVKLVHVTEFVKRGWFVS